jgi:hypothetical protein
MLMSNIIIDENEFLFDIEMVYGVRLCFKKKLEGFILWDRKTNIPYSYKNNGKPEIPKDIILDGEKFIYSMHEINGEYYYVNYILARNIQDANS